MLYVWPYIAFFSWPIILSSLIINVLVSLPSSITGKLPFKIDPRIPEPKIRLVVLLPALILTLLAIHYNTVIHPFTLADNRHYTFYVFRILRRNILIKYLFAPIYLFFAWACIGALTQSSSKSTSSNTKSSTLLLWLITSSLSLTTAPLVEPRYFLLPWITWRLIVSNGQPISDKVGLNSKQAHPNRNSGRLDFQTAVARVSASSLSIETLWYLFINGITGWIFLNKGFTWPNEPEEVMRFMW